MAWGIKSESGAGGLTVGGVHIKLTNSGSECDVWTDFGSPANPAGKQPDAFHVGEEGPEDKYKEKVKETTLYVYNYCERSGKEESTSKMKQAPDKCEDEPQHTWIAFGGKTWKLTGGEFRIVGDDTAMAFVTVTEGAEEVPPAESYEDEKYKKCGKAQKIALHHVKKLKDGDDPACWIVINGVSTYVCGCGS